MWQGACAYLRIENHDFSWIFMTTHNDFSWLFKKKLGASSKDIFWKSLKKIHHNGWKVQKILGIMKKDGCEKNYILNFHKKSYGLQIKKFGLGKI